MQKEFAEAIYEEYCVAKEVTKKSSIVKDLRKELKRIEQEYKTNKSVLEDDMGDLIEICHLEPYATHIYADEHRDKPSWLLREQKVLAAAFKEYLEKKKTNKKASSKKEIEF